jgi:hypothetical protein
MTTKSAIEKRFNDALNSPVRAQRERTPDDTTGYIGRHEQAWDLPKPGFESAIRHSLIALRDYACAHEITFGSSLADDQILGAAWRDMLRGLRALLNGETGRLDCGFLDGAICNLDAAAGFTDEL